MRPLARLLVPLLLSPLIAWPAHASNELNRCIGSDGTSIFTDKKCADVGAIERHDPPPVAGNIGNGVSRLQANACARKPEDLLHGIESAIQASDVNQIAAFYHWPGVSADGSVAIFKRLQALIDRPLLSIDLLYTQSPQDEYGYEIFNDQGRIDKAPGGEPQRHAYAVQVVQTRSANDSTPIRSALSLRRNVGCWWVQF